jgi:O-antigen/teichoic acid export membrane protein
MRVENIIVKAAELKGYFKESLVIMKRCLAIFIISFLAIFSLNIPRYFIDLFHNNEIGYFGILAMPITLIVLLMSFILQPNIVELSRLYAQKKYSKFRGVIKNICLVTLGISAATLLGAYAIGIEVLELVFGVDFDGYKLVLIVMLLGATANAYVAIFMNMLTIMRRFKAQFYTLLITNVVLAVLSAVLIGPFGVIMGTCLYMVSNIIQAGLLYFMFNKYMKEGERA